MSIFDVTLDTANKVYNTAWYISIIGAGLTFFSIATVFWSDSIRESFTERAIADARATAEQAKEGTARANERAAVLELQVAQAKNAQLLLEQSNLNIQLQLENERKERGVLGSQVGRLLPRSLTPAQAEILSVALSNLQSHGVTISLLVDGACPDCGIYAKSFVGSFQKAGINVINGVVLGIGRPPLSGLGVQVPDPLKLEPLAATVVATLQQQGIDLDIQQSSRGGDGAAFSLLFSPRP